MSKNSSEKKTEKPKLTPSMLSRILEFKAYLQLELGRSKNTASAYISDIEFFGDYLIGQGVESFDAADSDCAVGWLGSQSGTSATSQARRLSALKCFGVHMCDEGLWKKNFADSASRPKMRRKVPEVLTSKEIDEIISAANGSDYESVRDNAMIELMYGSGLRVSEICGLKMSEIDLLEGVLRVRGKGSKTRLVPVGKMSVEAIKKYLQERSKIKKNLSPELFITRRGGKLSRKTFWYNLKKYAAKSGIENPVKPHGLRHSFATHLLQNGANLMSIREMLGHSDLSTTQIYTQLITDDIRREYIKKHPRSKMKISTAIKPLDDEK